MNFVVVVCLTVHTNIQVKTAVNGKKKAIVLKKKLCVLQTKCRPGKNGQESGEGLCAYHGNQCKNTLKILYFSHYQGMYIAYNAS